MRKPVLLLFLAASIAFAVPKDWKKIPDSQLRNGVFTSADGLFSVQQPPGENRWYELPRDAGESIQIVVLGDVLFTISENFDTKAEPHGEAFMESARSGTETSARKHGGTIRDFRYDTLNVPVPNTWHYWYAMTEAGKTKHRFVYVIDSPDNTHRVMLQSSSDDPKEPPALKRLVVSFRWL